MNSGNITKLTYLDGYGQTGRSFLREWNRWYNVEVCFQVQYDSQVIIFFQAVRLIHEWMEEKLQTYFSRDTECLNHNTWMISCKLTFLLAA